MKQGVHLYKYFTSRQICAAYHHYIHIQHQSTLLTLWRHQDLHRDVHVSRADNLTFAQSTTDRQLMLDRPRHITNGFSRPCAECRELPPGNIWLLRHQLGWRDAVRWSACTPRLGRNDSIGRERSPSRRPSPQGEGERFAARDGWDLLVPVHGATGCHSLSRGRGPG